jgi:predicted DNA-binding protein
MAITHSLRDKIDYLVRKTGRSETEIFAEAIEEGLTSIYRKQIIDSYLSGNVDRREAIAELGDEIIGELDYALRSIEKDAKWGLEEEISHGLNTD